MSRKSIKRAVNVLAGLLAISFFFGAVTKFAPGETFFGPPYWEKFVEWGYPSWFRVIVGTGELIGGVLLVIPRFRFVGCVLLALILEGALVTHIVNNDPLAESIAAPVTLLLIVMVAIPSSPFEWRRLATAPAEGS